METLNNLTHLRIVGRDDGTYDIVKGSFEKVLGCIRTYPNECIFEPQDHLTFADIEAIGKIMLAIHVRYEYFLNRNPTTE